jgi:2-iminobutanoate/2-iminopropanoate deaminase
MEATLALKRTFVEPSWEAKYSYSPAVITEGGKAVGLAGHVGFVDDNGASLAGNFDGKRGKLREDPPPRRRHAEGP